MSTTTTTAKVSNVEVTFKTTKGPNSTKINKVKHDQAEFVFTNFTGTVVIKKTFEAHKKVTIKEDQEFVDLISPPSKKKENTPANTPIETPVKITLSGSEVETPFSDSDKQRRQSGLSIFDDENEVENCLDEAFQETQVEGLHDFEALDFQSHYVEGDEDQEEEEEY